MWLAVLRDAAIVLLAILSIVIGVLLALMLLQIRSLIRLLREEIAPMLAAANETMSTVQGTTDFVSRNVVRPVVQVSSYTSAALQVVRSLLYFRRGPRR
ncbi:MAG TPA: hypothetical protein GX714_08570 [Chloroflexi bacterium]|jgi:hypothetical protein|nr:hypothetical protein [Chloroflexota bacterium]